MVVVWNKTPIFVEKGFLSYEGKAESIQVDSSIVNAAKNAGSIHLAQSVVALRLRW
jgi:hypothetical protein